MQVYLKDYIARHAGDLVPTMDITWRELVRECHSMDMEEYTENVMVLKGKKNCGNNCENPGEEMANYDFWGSMVEIMAFCYLFRVGISIYIPQKLNKNYQIVENHYVSSDTRFYKIFSIQPFYSENQDDSAELEMNLVLYKHHYSVCL
jgi:hypothetical protein